MVSSARARTRAPVGARAQEDVQGLDGRDEGPDGFPCNRAFTGIQRLLEVPRAARSLALLGTLVRARSAPRAPSRSGDEVSDRAAARALTAPG